MVKFVDAKIIRIMCSIRMKYIAFIYFVPFLKLVINKKHARELFILSGIIRRHLTKFLKSSYSFFAVPLKELITHSCLSVNPAFLHFFGPKRQEHLELVFYIDAVWDTIIILKKEYNIHQPEDRIRITKIGIAALLAMTSIF